MGLAWRAVWQICLDEVVWKYRQMEKLSIFEFLLLFSVIKRKNGPEDGGQFIFLWEELSTFFIFLDIFITYKKKKMECSSEFFNFIPIDFR